jgi:predicted enzyme related to lactoylglutathione lyase
VQALRIDAVVFDCQDAAPLARFWAAALGWSVAPYDQEELDRLAERGIEDPEDDPSVMVIPPEEAGEHPVLFFTEVPEPKLSKNRVHLDIVARGTLEPEVERLESLGGILRNWAEENGSSWAVMLDPEGNEFCVMPPEGSAGQP